MKPLLSLSILNATPIKKDLPEKPSPMHDCPDHNGKLIVFVYI